MGLTERISEMYNINDKPAAIKEVQRLLLLNETGIYDNKTEEAVIEKQREAELEITGIVDLATFEAIVKDFKDTALKNRVKEEAPLEGEFPYDIGEFGQDTVILNAMLAGAIDKHALPLWRPKGGYYSKVTAAAVTRLREIFLLESGTHIDEIFYDRLKRW